MPALLFPHKVAAQRDSLEGLAGLALLELSAMACLLVLVVAATVLTGSPGKLTHAARTSPAEAFWRTALPGAPIPEAISELLRTGAAAGTNALHDVVRPPTVYGDDPPPPMNFKYDDYRSSRRNDAAAPSAEVLNRVSGARNAAASASPTTVFFLEEAVHVGGVLPFRTAPRRTPAAPPPPMRLYTVRAVRAVDGFRFVVCRREAGHGDDERGAVYGCRATGPARAYVVGVVGERGGETAAATAVVVCHTDVSRWDRRARAAFSLLDVKPGGAAVCHAALDAQVIPVENGESSSSSV